MENLCRLTEVGVVWQDFGKQVTSEPVVRDAGYTGRRGRAFLLFPASVWCTQVTHRVREGRTTCPGK